MYLAVIFGGKLPPKIAPKTKIAVIIVVNYYCKNGCSQRESNPQLALRRRLLYPFNYENECRIFGLFSLFGIGNHIYESNHSRDELPLFLILTSQAPLLESNSKFIPFSFQRVQPWLNLRRENVYCRYLSLQVNLSRYLQDFLKVRVDLCRSESLRVGSCRYLSFSQILAKSAFF